MNDTNSPDTYGLPDDPTPKQAEQALYDVEARQKKMRDDVIQQIGQLVLAEMEFAAENVEVESDDGPSAVDIFEFVRNDLAKEIRFDHPELHGLHGLYPWASSGCLFAKVWEQYVRIYPDHEPWPDNTEAAKWRSLEG
jgi:hypothetical protein